MERAPFCIGCLSAEEAVKLTVRDRSGLADALQGSTVTMLGLVGVYGFEAVKNALCDHCRPRVEHIQAMGVKIDPRARA